MKNTITTAVLTLMISESKLHRMSLADYIIEQLEQNVADFGLIEQHMRAHFISQLDACVENPKSLSRHALYDLAEFYREYYIESMPALRVAA